MFVVRLHSACTPASVLCKHLSGLQLLATKEHVNNKVCVLLPNASHSCNDQSFLEIGARSVTQKVDHMLLADLDAIQQH